MDYLQYQALILFTLGFHTVLNLVINGLPSIRMPEDYEDATVLSEVLNLVINGLPSILGKENFLVEPKMRSFKPCYKWITFNTYSKTYI